MINEFTKENIKNILENYFVCFCEFEKDGKKEFIFEVFPKAVEGESNEVPDVQTEVQKVIGGNAESPTIEVQEVTEPEKFTIETIKALPKPYFYSINPITKEKFDIIELDRKVTEDENFILENVELFKKREKQNAIDKEGKENKKIEDLVEKLVEKKLQNLKK